MKRHHQIVHQKRKVDITAFLTHDKTDHPTQTHEAVAASPDSDLDLLVSCFVILESAVAYLAAAEAEDGETLVLAGEEDKVKLRDILDAKQKSQVGRHLIIWK